MDSGKNKYCVVIGYQIFNSPRYGLTRASCKEIMNKYPDLISSIYEIGRNKNIRTVKDLIPESNKNNPLIIDIFTYLANKNPDGHFLFINSDVELNVNALKIALLLNKKNPGFNVDNYANLPLCTLFYRINYSPSGISQFTHGQDGFLIKSSWWLENKSKFEKFPNIIGIPYWDTGYTAGLEFFAGKDNVKHLGGVLYHREHKLNWDWDSIETKYNKRRWYEVYIKYDFKSLNLLPNQHDRSVDIQLPSKKLLDEE